MSEPTRLPLLEVSPVLEYSSPTPLSTHWMPLHELLVHWTDSDMLLALPSRWTACTPLIWIGQDWHAPGNSRASPARSRNVYGRSSRKCRQNPPGQTPRARVTCSDCSHAVHQEI
jgi:hypothetical protein